MENIFEELKRYVGFNAADEAALRSLHPILASHFERIADIFYRRILEHPDARKALEGGESQVGRLKVTLQAWMDTLLKGPWGEEYFQLRCRIGRVHVRIALPQHYMFGAMNVLRREMNEVVDQHLRDDVMALRQTRESLGKMIDLELAIMLHTYREDLLAQQARSERLATFGQLVGSIGHELRNPLGVIESSLFIIRGRAPPDEKVTKHLDRIGQQVGIANQIITDLLDMIRDRPLTLERLALDSLIAAVVAEASHPPGITFNVAGISELPLVAADQGQLRQVLVNLVDNAVQAIGETGQITIQGQLTQRMAEIAVEDTGPGVPEAIRKRLFEPLMTTRAKGIGLGLALVKRIVERHHGTIAYEPRHIGARFVIRLPLAD